MEERNTHDGNQPLFVGAISRSRPIPNRHIFLYISRWRPISNGVWEVMIAMCVLYFKGRSRSGDRSYRGRSRSGDRSYRGGVRRERSASGESPLGRSGEGRDQEIAPTGEVLGERGRHQEKSPLGEEVAIGRSLLQHFQTITN